VITVNIHDIREHEIPDVGYIELEDEETGEQILVDTSDQEFLKNYKGIMNNLRDKQKKEFDRLKIDTIQLKSDQSFDIPLKRFFRLREKRMAR